ncbi:MAG TPA: hypothetical protein VEX18_00095, partial [Polyangiaceae bacterium]|nr:hypothetical protein [Polyangiaceae bacterium]
MAASTGGIASGTGGAPSSGGVVGATGGAAPTTGGAATGGVATAGAAGARASGGVNAGGQPASGGVVTSGGGGATSNAGSPAGGTAAGGASGGAGNAGAAGKATAGAAATGGSGGNSNDPLLAKFSFFVVSYPAIIQLSGKTEGFGGDLRFGKADGLSGADEICRRAAEIGLPGAGQKTWRAFLSVTQGPGGTAVHARDRIGTGPWHDRRGRLIANNLEGLLGERPAGDAATVNDLPTEKGDPNH